MAEVIVKDKFSIEIEEDALNDWEIMESFREIDKGNVSAVVDVAPMLLGDEQYRRLKSEIKETYGKVKLDYMVELITELIHKVKELKNLQSSPE